MSDKLTPEQRKTLYENGITVTTPEDLELMKKLRRSFLESKIKKKPTK